MEKYKTLIIAIMICFIGGIAGLSIQKIYHKVQFQHLYNQILNENTNDVLFLGRPSCIFCNLLKPILEETSEKYHIQYRYINTDWLTKKELEKVLEKLRIKKESFSTPRLIITNGNRIKDHYIGYMDDINLFYYFQRNGLIDENEVFKDPYPNVERLSSEEYFKILDEKEDTEVLIGRIGDKNTNEILKEASDQKRGLKFLSPSVFLTEEEGIRFNETLKDMKEDAEIPILLEIKNGKVTKIMDGIKKANLENFK